MSNNKMIVATAEAILTFLGVLLGMLGDYPLNTSCVLLGFASVIGYLAAIIWWNHEDRKSWWFIKGEKIALPEEFRSIFSSGWIFAGGLVFFMMAVAGTETNLFAAPLFTTIASATVSIIFRKRKAAEIETT
jgi:hypothetical protein